MFADKKNIAISIALLFHVSGAIGILYTPYGQWFIENTTLNLLLMVGLLLYVQPKHSVAFYVFAIVAFATGMAVEIIGVNTGKLFGSYSYGNVMGPKLHGVPYLIGLQWFVTVFCAGTIMHNLHDWAMQRTGGIKPLFPTWARNLSLLVDGALLAVLFDYVMEPVAIKLGFWFWKDGEVPYFNYQCWFLISVLLLVVYRLLRFEKANQFALHLFIIQLLFFMALRIGL